MEVQPKERLGAVRIGQSQQSVTSMLGEPEEKIPGLMEGEVWIYEGLRVEFSSTGLGPLYVFSLQSDHQSVHLAGVTLIGCEISSLAVELEKIGLTIEPHTDDALIWCGEGIALGMADPGSGLVTTVAVAADFYKKPRTSTESFIASNFPPRTAELTVGSSLSCLWRQGPERCSGSFEKNGELSGYSWWSRVSDDYPKLVGYPKFWRALRNTEYGQIVESVVSRFLSLMDSIPSLESIHIRDGQAIARFFDGAPLSSEWSTQVEELLHDFEKVAVLALVD